MSNYMAIITNIPPLPPLPVDAVLVQVLNLSEPGWPLMLADLVRVPDDESIPQAVDNYLPTVGWVRPHPGGWQVDMLTYGGEHVYEWSATVTPWGGG